MSDMTAASLLGELQSLAEPDYRDFSAALNPGVEDMLGVRLPALRLMAKRCAKAFPDFWQITRSGALDSVYEGRMLQGLTLCYARLTPEERIPLLEEFLPKIDCWSVCDSTCTTAKFMKKHPEQFFPWLAGLTRRAEPYSVRFGLVCLMDYFIEQGNAAPVLSLCEQIHSEHYYVQMANAWVISVCAAKDYAAAFRFLEADTLDTFTHNKSIQKCRESFRLTSEQKAALTTLKRTE